MRGSTKDFRSVIEPRSIPSELEQFLRGDAFSLAIKGKAGTGKTTLALTVLSLAMKSQNCLYLSTRLATSELFQYHPWIQKYLVDSSTQNSEDVEPVDTAPFVDARLDEPSTLFERITNELMDTNSPLIIVDTWDAVGDFMDEEALMNNAKILQVWRQRARAKLVFVIENVEDKTFDNLVDGVIELEERYIDSRKTRRIHLSKLRGVRIRRPWDFFTLNQGIFHSFEPYNPAATIAATRAAPKLVLNDGADETNPNLNFFAELVDGLIPSQTRVVIELEPVVNLKSALGLVAGILANYVKRNNFVILLPLIGIPNGFVEGLLKYWVPDSAQRQRIQLVRLQNDASGNAKSDAWTDVIRKSVDKLKRPSTKSSVLGVGTIPANAGIDLELFEAAITSNCDSSLLITISDPKISEKLPGIADIRLKMREIEGTLFVQPENPWASFYAFENSKSDGGILVEPML